MVNLNEWIEVTNNAWNYEEQPEISGVLIRTEKGQYEGDNYILDVVGKGEVLVFGKTVLAQKLSKIKMGTLITICFLGTKFSEKRRKDYHDFAVYTKK